jgi:hypothetical protein
MRKTLFGTCFSLIALGATWSGASMADPGRGAYPLCYVWANNASSAINSAYTPSSNYSYNTVGRSQANRVTRLGTGSYRVSCRGVGGGALFNGSGSWGAGGNVQVTAYGSGSNYCKVGSWATGGADMTASVYCFNHEGQRANARFTLLFTW